AVAAVIGLIFPAAGSGWQKPGVLIVEKETGTRYLYVSGRLHPVLNLASVRLLTQGQPTVESVSSRALAGLPHGTPLGIPGAPDSLPDPARLLSAGWLICAGAGTDGTGAI